MSVRSSASVLMHLRQEVAFSKDVSWVRALEEFLKDWRASQLRDLLSLEEPYPNMDT